MERIYKIQALKNLEWLGQILIRAFKVAEKKNLEREFLKNYIIKLSGAVVALKKRL